ncbi:MAG: IspD/TarI family cytidylyltransferase [Clostridia bacterium]|nr:IspD/TarI family cytidylyltransferase [Clostridia bacterium]
MNYVIIFAGGKGTRMKGTDIPKQFLEIGGKSILCHTVEKFEKNPLINGIVVVANPDFYDKTVDVLKSGGFTKIIKTVNGGNSPIDSQYNGLTALKGIADDNDVILLHDGVRPLIDQKTITECIETVEKHGNAITVSPAIETIALIDEGGAINNTVDRNKCMLARAPQGVKFGELYSFHELSLKQGVHNFIDTASMLLYYGKTLNTVVGPQENVKVTTISDFYACKALIENQG